ncbi:MAG: hypothetical protein DRG40_02015 [Deltaproteobacteria bacterium]|nr:MAG: hypothetical protein DRG40_02015 [Deltaproteobacteria bacterium]
MQGLYKIANHIREHRLREKIRGRRSEPEQVYCFWLGERVAIHEASIHFNPLNPVCRSCAACMRSYAEEAVMAREIYEALSAEPRVVYDPEALQGVINLVADLESRLHRRKLSLEGRV